MDIVFCVVREIIVDDGGHALDVEAPGGHVGGDQHGAGAGLEVRQGPLTVVLPFKRKTS